MGSDRLGLFFLVGLSNGFQPCAIDGDGWLFCCDFGGFRLFVLVLVFT